MDNRIIQKVIRDQYGFFYVFMPNTIQRWDGKEFVKVDASLLEQKNNPISTIQKVELLRSGEIILLFDQPSQELIYIISGESKVRSKQYNDSYSFDEVDGQLIAYNTQHIKLYKDLNPTSDAEILPFTKPKIDKLIQMDSFWVVDDGSLVTIMDLQGLEFAHYPKNGQLIKSADNIIYSWSNEQISKLSRHGFSCLYDLYMPNFSSTFLKADLEGNIIAGYSQRYRYTDSLLILNAEGGLISRDDILDVNDRILDLYCDDIKRKWFIATYNGAYCISHLSDAINPIFVKANIEKTDFGHVIRSFDQDKNGLIYFARESNELYTYDPTKNETNILYQKYLINQITYNQKLILAEDRNEIIASAYYNKKNKCKSIVQIIDIQTKEGELFGEYDICIKDMLRIGSDTLLIAGVENGRDGYVAFGELDNYKTTRIVKDYLIGRAIKIIVPNKKNNTYWLGLYSGLALVDKKFELIQDKFDCPLPNIPNLNDQYIMAIKEYEELIVFATINGLYFYNKSSKKVVHYLNKNTGLSSSTCYALEVDNNNLLWVGTEVGLTVINRDLNIVATFFDFDGLPSREFNGNASYKSPDGNLYFGSINGITSINPKKIILENSQKGLYFSSLKTYQKDNYDNIIYKRLKDINLEHGIDSIIIQIERPDYYSYSYDQPLTDLTITSTPPVDMTVLKDEVRFSPKSYKQIEIKGSVGQNRESRVNILMPKNYNKFISILLIIGVVSLISYIISSKIIRLNKKREEVRTELNKRISDLQLTALQSQMNPHFIFNALGSVQYFIQTEDTEKADEFLADFAALMRLILESSKHILIPLQDELQLLKLYVGLEHVRFDHKFDYHFDISNSVDQEFKIPPMIFQPFIENAINHGLYHLSDRKGDLQITIQQKGDQELICKIKDNGIGREAAKKLSKNNHKSRGMQIVSERLEAISSSKNIIVNLNIKDLKTLGITGTEVTIQIIYP